MLAELLLTPPRQLLILLLSLAMDSAAAAAAAAATAATASTATVASMAAVAAAAAVAASDASNANANSTCFNEERVNLSLTPPFDGHFVCPDSAGSSDLTECCGADRREFCCSPWDTIGMKWAIGIGVTVAVVIFMALGYTIQLFRACDRCYHEFPVLCEPEEYNFSMDTRWYTVSHEGNRYGVTFHSMRFAGHFMRLLEAAYGPWNAANILRIRRDEQDFVVLHIFFNDFFTPWFYTQGPIKNDEEWIRTDFKDLCHQTQDDLAVRLPTCCFICCPSRTASNHSSSQLDIDKSENIELIIVPPVDDSHAAMDSDPEGGGGGGVGGSELSKSSSLLSPTWTAAEAAAASAAVTTKAAAQRRSSGSNGASSPSSSSLTHQQRQLQKQMAANASAAASASDRGGSGGGSSSAGGKRDHRPWTKHTFKVRPPPRPQSPGSLQQQQQQQQQRLLPQPHHHQESGSGRHRITTVIREDIIECYGNDKCIQTRCEIVI